MTTTAIDVTTIGPLTHDEAMRRQAQELERTLTLLRSLDDVAWTAATDCPAWDVRTMYQHVLGACEAGASIRENVRQLRRARAHRKQHGGPLEAALSAVQVHERAQLSPAQIIGRLAAVAPKTVRGRTRTPALIRNHAKLAIDGPVHETWKLGYFIDTIYLRDLWSAHTDRRNCPDRPAKPHGRPSAIRPWTAQHDGPQRCKVTRPGTEKKRPASTRIRS